MTEVTSYADVPLMPWELEAAAIVGVQRQARAIAMVRTPRFPFKNDSEPWGFHVCGALAEMAVAKYFGVFWNHGVDTFQRIGDVGGIEVRWTAFDPVRLKIKENDNDNSPVVCCSSKRAVVRLHGWALPKNVRRPEWLSSPREGKPAFFVPLDYLLPMYELRETLRHHWGSLGSWGEAVGAGRAGQGPSTP